MKIERNDGLSGLEKRRSGIVIAKQVTKKTRSPVRIESEEDPAFIV
jgi:hypothetical protein